MSEERDLVPKGISALTAETIRHWSSGWADDGLWDDILRLSERFWRAKDEGAKRVRWHHLVLAVGNFKRQPGRRLRPGALPSLRKFEAKAPRKVAVPVRARWIDVKLDDRASWERLSQEIPGAGVPTTTTLLAAMWPGYHFIFDWRVHAAANGLRIAHRQSPTPGVKPQSTAPTSETFSDYEIVRRWIAGTAVHTNADSVDVERALYRLSQQVSDSDHRTWRQYGQELHRVLTSEP